MPTPEEEVGQRLTTTTLRDFSSPTPHDSRDFTLPSYVLELRPDEAPIPVLLRHALTLIGNTYSGPGEKVAWWVNFTFKGYDCELAHQKFGLRLRIAGADLEEQGAAALLDEVRKKLLSAVKTVEGLLVARAPDVLDAGNVTVVNQHRRLRHAYAYFRGRATNPDVVEDVHESGKNWTSFLLGRNVMAMHASHDLVAAISAYVSSLEHDLVLALPFLDFNPTTDSLTKIIGDRWGEKWRRVVGHDAPEGVRLRERLTHVVERWRNPYSHGGFEKGHTATVYLHTPGLGALPVGLTDVRNSPLFSFHSASESQIVDVFELFDEIDTWLAMQMPHATEWIESDLDVRYDAAFMAMVVGCIESEGNLERLIEVSSYEWEQAANMDF